MSGLLWAGLFWADTSRDYFAVAVKSSGDSRKKVEEHVVTDLIYVKMKTDLVPPAVQQQKNVKMYDQKIR